MAIFNVKCCKCPYTGKILHAGVWASIPPEKLECPRCKEYILVRDPKGPSTSVKEVLDSGAMPRAVERYTEIEEMMAERNKNADPNAGKKNWS